MAGVSLVDDRAALLSMRNSDFDAYSAVGEVIDNSIQAAATTVRLLVDFNPTRQEPITSIAFGDDGTGMPSAVLHRCLQLGYSTRYNDRRGIGRFGVGATLAAINQCRRVEVYSKEQGGDWLYTHIDLDAITADPPTMHLIPTPTKRPVPDALRALVGPAGGTLVVWSKYDRQPAPASRMIDALHVWIGRTYRKFIWDGVSIFINGDIVKAVDPLYVTTSRTMYPGDPKAHEYPQILLPWLIPPEDRQEGGPAESIIKIRMSLLPPEFRLSEESGSSRHARERCIDLNEGVSILRNGREVFYDVIPWWPGPPFGGIDRWWGCEISFDAVLDGQFTVKNIKRGAVPVRELKQALNEKIEPTRHAALQEIRNHWNQVEARVWPEGTPAPARPALRQRLARAPGTPHRTKRPIAGTLVLGLPVLVAVTVGLYFALRGGQRKGEGSTTPSNQQHVTSISRATVTAPHLAFKPSPSRQLQVDTESVDSARTIDVERPEPTATQPPPAPEPVRVPAAERTGFVMGSGQRGRVGEPAPFPVVFEVRDSSGTALPGVAVSLSIVNGRLVGQEAETDSIGQVRAQVVFGQRAGVPTVVTGLVGTLVREATLYPSAGLPAKLVVASGGNTLAGQLEVAASRPVVLRIACRDAYDNALPLVGLRAAVGDEHVVQVTGVAVDSLEGSVTVQARRGGAGGATNLVIFGSGLRTDLSAVVAPGAAAP